MRTVEELSRAPMPAPATPRRGGRVSGRFGRARRATLVLLVFAAACSPAGRQGSKSPSPTAVESGDELVAQIASYDLHVGRNLRFLVGLVTKDGALATGGKARFAFSYLGTKEAPTKGDAGPEVEASFLAVPADEHQHAPSGGASDLPEGIGVYAATVRFDRPGFWRVQVTPVASDRATGSGDATFEVLPRNLVPGPGDQAPRSDNFTVVSVEAPKVAIDSRAGASGEVPDPELHRTTIRSALDKGRPVLVVISTPTYCVSRFCGPVTDMVADLAKRYGDRAEFVHIEVWRDREANSVNKAAAEWALRNGDLNEPWVFLVSGDGTVVARWDNVATQGEIEPLLQALKAGA